MPLVRHELDGDMGHLQVGNPHVDGVAGHRLADRLLADLFEVALEIPRRIDRGASPGAAADGARILHSRGDRSPQSSWQAVYRSRRSGASIQFSGIARGVDSL